jgi:3-methyladenine DNA glycosylase AlkD
MKNSAVNRARLKEYHLEVVEALAAIGNQTLGKAIQQNRGSQLEHLGIKFPDLRRRVRQGFSFYGLPKEQVLVVWDSLWRTSPYGDALFAALEFYAPLVKKQADPDLWPVMCEWIDRVDNWCHSDGLSAIYSWMLAGNPVDVYPLIGLWNQAQGEWKRRASLVSLIHYTGKNAVFMPLDKVLPLVTNCLDDDRFYVQTAVGWVLREMGNVHRSQINQYLKTHAQKMSAPAFSRAIERLNVKERTKLRDMRRGV